MVRSNPQWQRTADLKRLYGITEKDYQLLFEKQDGKCATCLKPATDFTLRLSVDHEHGHTAGHKMNQRACKQCIRGLLCWSCNRILLPMVETAMDRVERGIVYLKERPLA